MHAYIYMGNTELILSMHAHMGDHDEAYIYDIILHTSK